MNNNFEQKLKEQVELINSELEKIIKNIPDLPQKQIVDACGYSLFAGGKRIRPIILLEVCKSFGGDVNNALPFACAIEMIHTYSLIHDDLPCMDNDDLRRGKPTNHKVFGEAVAVLAGDALLNYSIEYILSRQYTCSNEVLLCAITELYYASGIFGMIGGQILDISSENKKLTVEEISQIHINKTGKLIVASAKIGAILASANQNEIENAQNFALKLGMAFQIIDDILDVKGNSEKLGKNPGKDAKSNKNTFVTLIGINKSENLVEKLTKEAIFHLNLIPNNEFLINLSNFLLNRQN